MILFSDVVGSTHGAGEDLQRSTVVNKAAEAIAHVMLAHMPPVPSENKWTKLYPCLAFFMTGDLFGTLAGLAERAFGDLYLHEHDATAPGAADPEYEHDVCWRKADFESVHYASPPLSLTDAGVDTVM